MTATGAAPSAPVEARQRRARRRTRRPARRAPEQTRQAPREGFRFSDPYWDDAFSSYYDPTLRTCCRI